MQWNQLTVQLQHDWYLPYIVSGSASVAQQYAMTDALLFLLF
jgi:hypothetical protein